ncbi:unnamed protein product [Soboliphyme baturini]|uniref:SERPIN domain-containing protein n=1 Tax=Soboliphyme baturini TaxID=241478 RepID=A0A183ITL8_9BILA|nr:unnamed protein product [Soboliphyme baturini]
MPVTIEEAFADFSLGLYREACATPDDAVLSPAAVSLALFPAYVGCKYDAHTQIQEALLGSKATEKDTLKCFADLSKVVDKKVTSPALRVSNRIYSQNGFTISDTYKRRLANECGSCDVVSIDFSSSAVFDKDVNRWANESTGGKMKQIASADMFPLSTKMVILSAASFNGRWQCEFVSSDTSKRTFYSNPTSSSKIYMMKQTLQCMYGENDACQVLQMDYTDKLMSLLIFLPKEKFGLKRFELNLSGAKIFNLINSVHRKAVKVVIPRFGLENSFSLKRSLLKMKITHVFNPDLADFTDMTTKRGLCISSVIHKAIIEVSEKGCEAAAVGFPSTAASLAVCMEPPKEFIADHPFLFMVIEKCETLFVDDIEDLCHTMGYMNERSTNST